MSVVSTSLKNDIASQKDIFRLAATIYSETNNVVSDTEVQLQIIKCMFVATGNDYLTKSEIIAKLLDIYKYHISEDEVDSVIKKSREMFLSVIKDESRAFCLTQQARNECVDAQKYNIDSFVDQYIVENGIADKERFKNAIHIYLYELTTTNINSYRILLAGKDGTQFTSSELSVDLSDLTDSEKQLVHDFLCWNNPEKNTALGNLVYCCLEYCLLINGDSPNKLLQGFIKRREIYLDTNVVFRALGINGISRKTVVTSFLNKCKQAKLKLFISHATKREFFDTIDYYVSQMEHFPRGNIYTGAYEQIADFNIFAFYEEWRESHPQFSLKYFIAYIKSLYLKLVKEYDIDDDVKISAAIYHSDEFKDARNRYSLSINHVKQRIKDSYLADDYSYTQRDSHDATVIRYIEMLREKSADNDIFLASSDKALRLWDMNRRDIDYPVVVYPSQLFLILLKTCGRSENDYDSFVSFINIRPSSKQISPENAHIILSGISSISEDIKVQKHLVAAVYDDDFQNVIKTSSSDADLYEKVQRISQNYLDEELKQKDKENHEVKKERDEQKTVVIQLTGDIQDRDARLEEKQNIIANKTKELEEKQDKISRFAEKQTRRRYIGKVYITPALLILSAVLFVVFVVMQIFFGDKDWNVVTDLFDWLKATAFGKDNDGIMFIVDSVFFGIIGWMFRQWWINPFNEDKKRHLKHELAQKYIENNKLD